METLAWAAGLFEGEGSIVLRGGKLALQMKMVDRESVARFAAAVGDEGHVLGPYKNRTGEKDGYDRHEFYVWTSRVHQAKEILQALWPYLGTLRRLRALELGFEPTE